MNKKYPMLQEVNPDCERATGVAWMDALICSSKCLLFYKYKTRRSICSSLRDASGASMAKTSSICATIRSEV